MPVLFKINLPSYQCNIQNKLDSRFQQKIRLHNKTHPSGQISIIPKPELRGFWGSSLIKPPFRVTSADVVIICPDPCAVCHGPSLLLKQPLSYVNPTMADIAITVPTHVSRTKPVHPTMAAMAMLEPWTLCTSFKRACTSEPTFMGI